MAENVKCSDCGYSVCPHMANCATCGRTYHRLPSIPSVRFAQLVSDNARMRIFIEGIERNYDCDADGHKYKTYCRVCEAKELLATLSNTPAQQPEEEGVR